MRLGFLATISKISIVIEFTEIKIYEIFILVGRIMPGIGSDSLDPSLSPQEDLF